MGLAKEGANPRSSIRYLSADLSVADGEVDGQCRLRKRFIDFRAFLLATVIPEGLARDVHAVALTDNSTRHEARAQSA